MNVTNNRNNASFRATPKQILDAVENANICMGKKMFLTGVANAFKNVEKELVKDEFVYSLGKKNKISNNLPN